MQCVRALVLLFGCTACSSGPYFIGEQHRDGGRPPSECDAAFAAALACSGFEASDLTSEWPDQMIVNAGELERTTERAHSGEAALRAASNGPESVAVVFSEVEPVVSGTLYLRVHLYVPSGLPTETINILFIGSDPAPDPFIGLDINVEDGALQIFSPQNDPARVTGELTIPRDAWFCLRAEIAVSDGAGAVELFVDGALALAATGLDTLPDDGVHLIRAGVDWSSGQETSFEIYLDDLVLDDAPVACARATAP
jgi:hypothetical protein